MNFFILKKVKLILLFILLVLFFFPANKVIDKHMLFYNSSNIMVMPIPYDTDIIYNDQVVYGYEQVISSGQYGYISSNGVVLVEPINEVIEIGRGYLSSYSGSTTGYGADCDGCSGIVSCATLSGSYHDLSSDGIYYNDSKYGTVRILAADNTLFSCGTIIQVDNGILEPFMGIVLDTGGAMRNAWRYSNQVLIDIAFSSENSIGINNATNKTGQVKFKVYRNGW